MCGIAGIVGAGSHKALLDTMLDAQAHRGPDAQKIYAKEGVVLGHNRLSIIDLSSAADQPFYSQDGRYTLIFNGEIYNYLELKQELQDDHYFGTQSDTEVLLAAFLKWGSDCLSRLNGMFSFAIWDAQEEHLFAARDRFGVKPFYYQHTADSFFFASEIKSLFAAGIPRKPNEAVWASYFVYGSYGMPNETFWKDIAQLPGGYFLELTKNKVQISQWYDFLTEVKKYDLNLSFDAVKMRYLQLLDSSINLRFRADVPLGFNVSGGLDSSALLALVNRKTGGKNINAFTFYTGDERYDELPWVEDLIDLTKNPLHRVLFEADHVLSSVETMSALQDEPYGGVPTMAYAAIFEEARTQGVKVLLDGQGMDEQWAGYDYYAKQSKSTIQGVTGSPFKKNVLSETFLAKAKKPIYPEPFEDHVLNLQYRDLFYTKIPRALRFNDRVSMAASTELREPFLDYRLVEFAFAQPLKYKIKDGVQKYLLRNLVSEHLSGNITYAPKRPLQTPMREWLGNELAPWVQEVLDPLKSHAWFDKEALQVEFDRYRAGAQDSGFHIWQWVNTSLLLHQKTV